VAMIILIDFEKCVKLFIIKEIIVLKYIDNEKRLLLAD
jgi:hypothetical protein